MVLIVTFYFTDQSIFMILLGGRIILSTGLGRQWDGTSGKIEHRIGQSAEAATAVIGGNALGREHPPSSVILPLSFILQ